MQKHCTCDAAAFVSGSIQRLRTDAEIRTAVEAESLGQNEGDPGLKPMCGKLSVMKGHL
ncbi:hypothetical protein PAXRUDRAFT_20438 [Paxillus rubicundulus Ve08.2h10]|uniref:Uncharacterized protein n=1 Tax=Paxillus rubicundulus Ve08.2h10 TaxID=930991 RepID=A0A0D0D1T8_9AGAM|nr:hypothetical protein PAXRUDRAFT_20438 [Paxillus rubicundulus Ve08.2h10]